MSSNSIETASLNYQNIIKKCWSDENFKKRFIEDPATLLQQEGIEVPEGTNIKVVENTSNETHFVIPMQSNVITDEMLENVASGGILPLVLAGGAAAWLIEKNMG